MRLLEFFKWWWDRSDVFERSFGAWVVFFAIPSNIACIWYGANVLFVMLFGALFIMFGWLLYGFFCAFRNIWNEFNDERPPSEIHMMRILKGEPTPSRRSRNDHYYP